MFSLFAQHALLPSGWSDNVRIDVDSAGTITDVIPSMPDDSGSCLKVDAVIPGMANLHSHAHQRIMAGLTEQRGDGQDSFWSWRKLMYALLEDLSPEHLEAIAALVYKEMLESGYTAVGEFHYLHHQPDGKPYANIAELCERIAAAASSTGIGLTLLPVRYGRGGADNRPTGEGQRRFVTSPQSYEALLEGATQALAHLPADAVLGIAPHSLRAVKPAELKVLIDGVPKGPVHIHVAEQLAEVEEVSAMMGKRPVRWLLDSLDINERWVLIHATHLDAGERRDLATSAATAGLCPITEANLGDGIFPAVTHLAGGGHFGIGSDSNVRISLAEELRTLEYTQRLRDHTRAALADPGGHTGTRLFTDACAGGARAVGRLAGAIAPGMLADLVALDTNALALAAARRDQWLDAWIFSGADRDVVRDVWSAGRHVVRDGRHIQAAAIEARYREVAKALLG
jgi:formimidoylglutamate deiminase